MIDEYKVFGPPGTGKTTYLLNEVKFFLKEGVPLHKIGYFAFTKKAANEAKNRMPHDNKKLTHFQTLHSLAFHTLGLTEDRVMQPIHYEDLGKLLNIRVHYEDKFNEQESFYLTCDSLYYQLIGRAANKDISFEEEYNTGEYPRDEIEYDLLRHIAINLAEYKKKNNLIDFNDMVKMFLDKEEQCPKFEVVFIDEAQDLSPIQWQMVDVLKKKTDFLYLAGDDDQAIYTWAGADVDRFVKEPCDHEIILDQSRRIPFSVQEQSEVILNKIQGVRKHKKYFPKAEEGFCQKINDLGQVNLKEGKWLILTRTKSRMEDVMTDLTEAGLFFENKKGKSVKMGLWKAILNFSTRKKEDLTESELKAVEEYTGQEEWPDAPWYECFINAKESEKDYIRRMLDNGEKLSESPRIKISTIHAAKGGEEENVIVFLDNSRKIRRAVLHNQAKRDEEHRVWYVGFTRASRNLYLHTAKTQLNGYDI